MSTKIAGSIHTDAPARKPRTKRTLTQKVAALDKKIDKAELRMTRLRSERDMMIREAESELAAAKGGVS